MRYAVVSDIHGNRQAWKAVLTDIQSAGVEEVLCLGDVVGYGPAPAKVLESAYRQVHHFVLGNHDAALAGKLDTESFNDQARRILDWTRDSLDPKAADFLGGLPLVLRGHNFRCAHAEFATPQRYRYILDPDDTPLAWNACDEPVVFVGHTHVPALFVVGASGTPHKLDPQDFQTEPGKRYIVNCGSVGQPRDGDMRASYCIFDSGSGDLFFRRVPFDVEAYRDDLRDNAVPEAASWFLGIADQTTLKPVREALDFSPPARSDARLAENAEVKELETATRAARRWRLTAVALLLLAIISAGIALAALSGGPERLIMPALQSEALAPPSGGEPLIDSPAPIGQVSLENRLATWTVVIDDPDEQLVQAVQLPTEEGARSEQLTGFRVESSQPGRFMIMSPPVNAAPGTRYTATGQFQNIDLQDGYLEVAILEETAPGRWRVLDSRQPRGLLTDRGWQRTSVTLERGLPQETVLRYAVRGEFTGEVLIRKNEFFRRE